MLLCRKTDCWSSNGKGIILWFSWIRWSKNKNTYIYIILFSIDLRFILFFIFKFKHFYSCRKRIIIFIFLLILCPKFFYFLCIICYVYCEEMRSIPLGNGQTFLCLFQQISSYRLLFSCPLNRQHLFIYFWPKKYTKLQVFIFTP